MVTNTASATLNQLIVSIFEKVNKEDKERENGKSLYFFLYFYLYNYNFC